MTMPDFIIIGAQKAGSSWLANRVRMHNEIFMPKYEVHYFNLKENYIKGKSWYEDQFAKADKNKLVGEKTPNYLWVTSTEMDSNYGTHLPFVNRNIYQLLPETKLIMTLRNPVDRAVSAYNHYSRFGQINPMLNVNDVLVGDKQDWAHKFGILDMGLYYQHIQAYLEFFATEDMLILIFEEDIISNPKAGLRKVFDFLNVESDFKPEEVSNVVNPYRETRMTFRLLRHYFPRVSRILEPVRQYIPDSILATSKNLEAKKVYPTKDTLYEMYDFFESENNKIFKFLGREIPSWKMASEYD